MHYKTEIVIDLPRARVIELFDSIDNLKHWQPGLQAIDHISGTPGEVGAKSQLHFLMGKRRVEMVETITVKNLPDEFTGTYEAKGVFKGRLDLKLPEVLVPGADYFLCGPKGMLTELSNRLQGEGVPEAKIHSEGY